MLVQPTFYVFQPTLFCNLPTGEHNCLLNYKHNIIFTYTNGLVKDY